jgi:hypothetical protein
MKSILETCTPRPDILTGTFNPEIFTANLSQVVEHYRGRATTVHNLYTDADQFFSQATYPTEGMRTVLSEVMARLQGNHSVPAIHRLETAFGGGKTHTLIALTHLGLRGRELATVAAGAFQADIFSAAALPAPGDVAVVGIAGDEIPVHQPIGTALVPYTLWGEIAFQIGGEDLYRAVEMDARSYAAPGKDFLNRVFEGRKVMLMLDELAQYATRLSAARPDGADQLAAFLMALQNYASTHPGIAIVLTLASYTDAFARQTQRLAELISTVRGQEVSVEDAAAMAETAGKGVQSVVARFATGVIPVHAGELSRVLAKRLFDRIDQAAGEETAHDYMALYARNSGLLPDRASRADFQGTLTALYPFHPTFIEFLNNKMATLENFQGTRGVLRVLALAVRSLWSGKRLPPMIHTCHLNLRDARIVNELISRTGSGDLLVALNADVGGVDTGGLAEGMSRAQEADRKNPHPEGYPLHEYAWKTVFLHSLVGRGEGLTSNLFGITERDALFEVSFPGLTPPQVQTALQEIQNSALYLRFSQEQGRYYASLDASINRALDGIRRSLPRQQLSDFLAASARKVITSDPIFKVFHEVSLPEHIDDNVQRPCLGLIALDADEIDAEAFITTVGPNKPRIQQNLVFLLVPRTVHVKGEIWNEERVARVQDLRDRLEELAREVLARRRLKEQPQNYGIRPRQLAEEQFDGKSRERELALQTTLTLQYDSLWFPSASGQVTRKDIHTAGGEGGAPIVEQIRTVLRDDGELITAERARTQEGLSNLARLFFEAGQTPMLHSLREAFAVKRRWPILENAALFEQIIREGVNRGLWCLFRMDNEESVKPAAIYSRDTDPPPFELDLRTAGWSIISVAGARQRGWLGGEVVIDPMKLESWVQEAMCEVPTAYVAELIEKVQEKHGEVPDTLLLGAVDKLAREEGLAYYAGTPDQHEKPSELVRGAAAILHSVSTQDVLVTPAEASRRGWLAVEPKRYQLSGREAAQKFLPLLKRVGSLYSRGAKSTLDVLDLVELPVAGGARLRITLQGATPETMQRLGEWFEILGDLVQPGGASEGRIQINDPDDNCAFLKALKEGN